MIKLAFSLAIVALSISFYQQEPPPTDFVMAGAVAVLFVYFLVQRKLPRLSWPERFAAGFLMFNLLQLLADHSSKSLFWVGVTTFLILSFFALKALAEKFGVKTLFKAYLVAAFINMALMFVAFIALYSFNHNFELLTEFGRAQGLFKDPNVAGPFLIPALIYFLNESVEKPRLWKLLSACALLSGVFFSFSRGALIALAVAIIFWLVAKRAYLLKDFRLYLAVLIYQGVTLLILFSYGPFAALAQERFKLVHTYDTQSRSVSWQSGLQGFANNPGGSGPGSFESGVIDSQKELIRQKINALSVTDELKKQMIQGLETDQATQIAAQVGVTVTPSAHNTYLRVLRENGIVGITIFMAFILSVIWLTRRVIIQGNKFTGSQIAMLTAWLGFLANGLVIDTLHWRLFWYLPALLLASLELKRAKS